MPCATSFIFTDEHEQPVTQKILRIATRPSPQARTQAQFVADSITRENPEVECKLVFVESTGDQRADVPLHQMAGQGIFVKEVQQAVLDGRADIAVHSAKDLPTITEYGLEVGAWCARRSHWEYSSRTGDRGNYCYRFSSTTCAIAGNAPRSSIC